MSTIFAKDIDKLSVEDQLKFYKDQFQSRHCYLTSHELRDNWVIYEGETYTKESYDWQIEEETRKAKIEIERMNSEIEKLKEKYDLSILDYEDNYDFANLSHN